MSGLDWRARLYFAIKHGIGIPPGGLVTGDHLGWGRARWIYLAPFLLVRRLLVGSRIKYVVGEQVP